MGLSSRLAQAKRKGQPIPENFQRHGGFVRMQRIFMIYNNEPSVISGLFMYPYVVAHFDVISGNEGFL
jgi:hypothetical protein